MKKKLARIGLYAAVIAILVQTVLPFAWLFISSIISDTEILAKPPHWIPEKPTGERYASIVTGGQLESTGGKVDGPAKMFRKSMLNSFVITTTATVISLFVGSLAAFVISNMKFRFKNHFLLFAISVQMLPQIATIIPLYFIIRRLNLSDTYFALILLYCSFIITYVIWIMSGFFGTIPKELEDSARIDGCSRFGALFRIIMPIAAPGLVATGILSFLMAWDEFMYALIFTNTGASKTIPVAISEFSTQFSIDYGMMTTGGVLASIPPVLLAMFFQKYIIHGLSAGAVKG
jgi:multiple sugar transport system permease protein